MMRAIERSLLPGQELVAVAVFQEQLGGGHMA